MGPEDVTRRDVENFLAGRDMVDARVVDQICDRVRQDPKAQSEVAQMFNNAAGNMMSGMRSNKYLLAMTQTLQDPEFSDVRDHMIRATQAIQKAMEGFLENDALAEAMEDNPRTDQWGQPTLFVQMKPENAELLVCDPNFMDPLARISNMKPLSEERVDQFNDAVSQRARALYPMDEEAFRQEAVKAEPQGQDLLRRFGLVDGPGI